MIADPARLGATATASLLAGVDAAAAAHRADWPGPPATRQPVQVLYVPADRVRSDTPAAVGVEASDLLRRHGGSTAVFTDVMGLASAALAEQVRTRVRHKLATEPMEDLRVDFEDGYVGHDAEAEAADAVRTGRAVAAMMAEGTCPPFVGLRVKSFADGSAARSVATLDRFLGGLLEAAGALPDGFVVTFPKIVSIAHVTAFVEVLSALEQAHGLAEGTLGFEAQIETPASVLGPDGRVVLRDIRAAARGRLRAVHFGVFDYTAALGLPAAEQRLDHPACDLARHLMQVTFAETEVRLSDGSTNMRPAGEGAADVHAVWRRHAAHVRHSLAHGFVQGWDLHPSHLVSRYTAVFAHLLDGMDDALDRIAAWQAGRSGGPTMDEPATIRVLHRQVARARDCGALPPD